MTSEATMRAIRVCDDEDRSLEWTACERPTIEDDEVLVAIEATAVNRADLLQRRGLYPPPEGASEILGLEMAGHVVEIGDDVDDWSVGDSVCALLTGGGYAEYTAVSADMLLPIPEGLSAREAAALPEVFYTAYLNVFVEGDQTPGEHVLVHAGASGVGTAAIQLCRLFDSPVHATASGPKLPFLRELGVEAAIDRHEQDFAEIIPEATEGTGVDIVLDPVGGDYLERNIEVLARQGRLIVIGLLGGTEGTLALDQVLTRRLRIVGSVLRSRPLEEKVALTERIRDDVWPHFESGALEPVIDETLPIEEAGRAHELLAANETIGKVVLDVGVER